MACSSTDYPPSAAGSTGLPIAEKSFGFLDDGSLSVADPDLAAFAGAGVQAAAGSVLGGEFPFLPDDDVSFPDGEPSAGYDFVTDGATVLEHASPGEQLAVSEGQVPVANPDSWMASIAVATGDAFEPTPSGLPYDSSSKAACCGSCAGAGSCDGLQEGEEDESEDEDEIVEGQWFCIQCCDLTSMCVPAGPGGGIDIDEFCKCPDGTPQADYPPCCPDDLRGGCKSNKDCQPCHVCGLGLGQILQGGTGKRLNPEETKEFWSTAEYLVKIGQAWYRNLGSSSVYQEVLELIINELEKPDIPFAKSIEEAQARAGELTRSFNSFWVKLCWEVCMQKQNSEECECQKRVGDRQEILPSEALRLMTLEKKKKKWRWPPRTDFTSDKVKKWLTKRIAHALLECQKKREKESDCF